MIRLSALRTFGQGIRQWCCSTLLPLALVLVVARQLCSTQEQQQPFPYWFLALLVVVWNIYYRLVREQKLQCTKSKESSSSESTVMKQRSSTRTTTGTINHGQQAKSAATTSKDHIRNSMRTTIRFQDFPTDVAAKMCGFLHPRDVTTLACADKAATRLFAGDEIWKALWYRDYGNVLLQWKLGRDALQKSLLVSQRHSNAADNNESSSSSLEVRLSQHLDSDQWKSSLREFYFDFGETYINFLLAGRNSVEQNNCYLGLHGHVINFSPFADYHPGLIDPVLLECGQDATEYFEGLPHSRGARAIARQLVVVVNKGVVDPDHACGLQLRTPVDNLQELLRISNSRPILIRQDNKNGEDEDDDTLLLKSVFPQRPHSPTQRAPTLARIRATWDATKNAMGKWDRTKLDPLHRY